MEKIQIENSSIIMCYKMWSKVFKHIQSDIKHAGFFFFFSWKEIKKPEGLQT